MPSETAARVDRLKAAVREWTDSDILFDMVLTLMAEPDIACLCAGRMIAQPTDDDGRFQLEMTYTLEGKRGVVEPEHLQYIVRSMLRQTHDNIGKEKEVRVYRA